MRISKERSTRVMTEKDETGDIKEFEGKSNVERTIFVRIHNKRFYTADQTPICKVVYLATLISARQVLDQPYDYPEWFDSATYYLCKECAHIRL